MEQQTTHSPDDDAERHEGVSYVNDIELVRNVLDGSLGARRSFAQRMRCVPRMLVVRNKRLASPFTKEDLEDLTQDTLVSIWRRLDSYAGRASLETWVYRFCQNQFANRLRARGRRPVHVATLPDDAAEDVEAGFFEYEDVYQAIDRVDARDAGVIRLKHFEHLSFDEIGELLNISPNTAKSRYYRALVRLRDMLAPMRRERAS